MSRHIRTNFKERKRRRLEEAVVRQEHWSGLSFEQQLGALDSRRGESTKQRARIATQIVERDKPKTKPKGKQQHRQRRKDKK